MKAIKIKELKKDFCIISGPCSVESEEQMMKTISPIVKNIDILRGGAFKPRTSPESFQGLGEEGLKILKKVSDKFDIPFVTEVMDTREVGLVSSYADILQIGARNMQNYPLLKEVGKTKKPVLLKRGLCSTIKEWIFASKYITKEGNEEIILCERGIRTFEEKTRFTLDLAGALIAKKETGFKVIIDPSHATGRADLIKPLLRAGKAAGLDGAMIEVHFAPGEAKSDGDQSLTPEKFNNLWFDKP